MKRVIVDYKKLTHEILALLVEKYPEGYGDSDIISFKNAKNEVVEALEVRTEDTIYLVKVSTRLATSMENFDEEEEFIPEPVITSEAIGLEEEEEEEDNHRDEEDFDDEEDDEDDQEEDSDEDEED